MKCKFICSFLSLITVFSSNVQTFLIDSDKSALRIAAFNIQHFGVTKVSDPIRLKRIVDILSRYDVVLIQEVRDSTLRAIYTLHASMKEVDKNWVFTASGPLGRSSYKEQYVFFYKDSSISLESIHQVADPKDVYEREPFAINIKYYSASRSEVRQVILAGIHVRPSDAKIELKELDDTIKVIDSYWPGTDGVIMMGDFNADCNYLAKIYRDSLPIFTDSEFDSLIGDNVDTTVKDSDCAYDRIVLFGDDIDARNAKAFNFTSELKLSQDEAEDISDHYPVEFMLY